MCKLAIVERMNGFDIVEPVKVKQQDPVYDYECDILKKEIYITSVGGYSRDETLEEARRIVACIVA